MILKPIRNTIKKTKKIYNWIKKLHVRPRLNEIEKICIENMFLLNKIYKINNEKIRIVFLFVIPTYWPQWESFYESCLNDKNFDVTLLFLNMDEFLNKTSQHENAKAFLDNNKINYIPYEKYDIYKNKPHIIVYQTPYQWYYKNFPEIKVEFVKRAGIRPVYISYGIEYDMTINCNYLQRIHFQQPLQQLAWKIFVMHDDIKKDFMRYCISGGNHVKVFGHPRFDAYKEKIKEFPHEIKNKAQGKKIVTYQIHLPNDNDCKNSGRFHTLSFSETRKNISYLQSRDDIFTIITIHPAFKTNIKKLGVTDNTQFEIFERSIAEHNNTFLYSGDYQILIANSDAFITENSSLMFEMAYFDKPVLYLYDVPVILRQFAQKIVDTFYHGHDYTDIKSFLDDVTNDINIYSEKRKEIHNDIFSCYDGSIGEKIKNYILMNLENESNNKNCLSKKHITKDKYEEIKKFYLISDAQSGEDIILYRFLHSIKNGFYVDVGASHPTQHSLTNLFYQKGWSGFNIDPRSDMVELYKSRPHDKNFCTAISNYEGTQEFFVNGGLSTFDIETAKRLGEENFSKTIVNVTKLNTILNDNLNNNIIHILKIDVKNHEKNILESIDLSFYRPWMIVIESTLPRTKIPSYDAWEYILLNNRYTMLLDNGSNRYYGSNEKLEVLKANFDSKPIVPYMRRKEFKLIQHSYKEM